MSVILIGYRGSGKTTVGKRLAGRLWQTFVDTDDLVIKKAGKSIADIFAGDGEPHFRALEAEAVSAALMLEDHVISLGGGAVLDPETRTRLKTSPHKRIYLKCDIPVLAARLSADPNTHTHRPGLTMGGVASSEAEIEQVMTVREPIYREVMSAELDVTHLTPEDAMTYLVRLM